MLAQNDGNNVGEVRTVYYAGTDTVQEGYALCWDTAANPAATDPKTRLGAQVVKPATANLLAFAGFVTLSSAGKVGPCYLDILIPRPGDILRAFTHSNQTVNSTVLKLANADYGLVTDGSPTPQASVATAMVTVDTSTTAAVNYVRML